MKVIRKMQVKTNEFFPGDQCLITLDKMGSFMATAQKVTNKGVLWLFDECVTMRPMNENGGNSEDFGGSDLKQWIDSTLLKAFPTEMQNHIHGLSIPTVGEFFGYGRKYTLLGRSEDTTESYFEKDADEQLVGMETNRNRIAYLGDIAVMG